MQFPRLKTIFREQEYNDHHGYLWKLAVWLPPFICHHHPPKTQEENFFVSNLTEVVLTSTSTARPSSESLAHVRSPTNFVRKGDKCPDLSFRNGHTGPWPRPTPPSGSSKTPSQVLRLRVYFSGRHWTPDSQLHVSNPGLPTVGALDQQRHVAKELLEDRGFSIQTSWGDSRLSFNEL